VCCAILIGKLYRRLNRITIHHNDLTTSPQLLSLLPLLISSNLSWNPRLRGQWIDWTQESSEYKPKKTFIPAQVLQRRVHSAVQRLDSTVQTLPAPPTPETLYYTAEEAKLAKQAAEDAELTDFQNNMDDSVAVQAKASRKARAKNSKRLKQALGWHASLRAHLAAYTNRDAAPTTAGDRLLNQANVSAAQLLQSAHVLPSVDDLKRGQAARLNSTMCTLFTALQKQYGSAIIGTSWEQAMQDTTVDLLEDRKCAELLADLPIGGELQDSIEALQYLINECDCLLMVTELRHLMKCHARRVHLLRLQQQEDTAIQGVGSGIKARLAVLSEAARKAVHDRHDGDAAENIDAPVHQGGLQPRSSADSHPDHVNGSDDTGTQANGGLERSGKISASGRGSPVMGLVSGLAGLSTRLTGVAAGASTANADSHGNGEGADMKADSEIAGGDTESSRMGFETSSVKDNSPLPATSFSRKNRDDMSRKEVAVDHVDTFARNVKVNAKVRRAENTLQEEAAKLNQLILDALSQLQKPQLGMDFAALPLVAFSPVAVEGTFPGIVPGICCARSMYISLCRLWNAQCGMRRRRSTLV
jgi:hypothetical protein